MDEMIERLEGLETPEPRTRAENFRGHLNDYTSRYFFDESVDPGAMIEAVLFGYDDRHFDFKKTGQGYTLRMIGGRDVFHAGKLIAFDKIGVIAGPEGEMLFDDLGMSAEVVEITDFRYADDFVIIPMMKETDGRPEPPRNQRLRAKRVSNELNDRSHPHVSVAATKNQAQSHLADLDGGGAEIISNPNRAMLDIYGCWTNSNTAVIYQNSAMSRGIDAPFFDISVVASTGFATPYWEARRKHYDGEDRDEKEYAAAIEAEMKSRELTNAVLRAAPTWGLEDVCGTKFIVVANWDTPKIKYIPQMLEPFQDPEKTANFLEQITIQGENRAAAEQLWEEKDRSDSEFMEAVMRMDVPAVDQEHTQYDFNELQKWVDNRYFDEGTEVQRVKNAIPPLAEINDSELKRSIFSNWSNGRVDACLTVLREMGHVNLDKQYPEGGGHPEKYWESNRS